MKLYRVTLRGMAALTDGQVNRQVSFVIADNAEIAYKTVRKFLDEKGLGFGWERELDNVALLAEEKEYTDTGHMLFKAQQTMFDYDPKWRILEPLADTPPPTVPNPGTVVQRPKTSVPP